MPVIEDLQQLSSAEEFFRYLEVPFEPAVLNVSRLHIMRLLGNLLREESVGDESAEDAVVRQRIREHLQCAYEQLESEGPLSKRLFKVHQDAVRPASPGQAFVSLSTIVSPGGRDETL